MASSDILLDDPSAVSERLDAFQETVDAFFSQEKELIKTYPRQWVAFHSGELRAYGPSQESVLTQLETAGLSREGALVRYMGLYEMTVFL